MAKTKEPKSYALSEEVQAFKELVDRIWDSDDYKTRRDNMNRWWKEYQGYLFRTQEEKTSEDIEEDPDSQAVANFIFSNIQAIVPLLTDNKPKWGMRAKRSHFQPLVNVLDRVADYYWDTRGMDEKNYAVVQDAMLFGMGLFKPYWHREEKDVGIDVEDPRTFVCSPGYEEIWDSAWCGFKKRLPITWFASKFPEEWKSGKIKAEDEGEADVERSDADIFKLGTKSVEYYEFWIRDERVYDQVIEEERDENGKVTKPKGTKRSRLYPNGRILQFTKDCLLGDYASPFAHGKPPLVPIYDYRIPHSIWGMGEPSQIETLVLEFNRILRAMVLKAHLGEDPNYVFQAGCGIDDQEFKNTYRKGGQVYTVNAGISAQDVITVVPIAPMSRENLELLQAIPALIEEINGIVAITKGVPNKKQRQSASEITSLMESAYTRMRQKVRNLEWGLQRLLFLITELIQQFYTDVHDISIAGKGDERYWVPFSMDKSVVASLSLPERDEEEEEVAYQKRILEDKDYNALLQELEKAPTIHAAVDIVMDTNSTLPMDKQSLANLMLRLAEIRVTPDSIADDVSVLETLNVPNREKILERKAAMRQQMMAAKMQGEGGGQVNPPGGDLNLQSPQVGG